MEKQITFQGVNNTPYSDISPDGQLSHCSGLERHAGSLRPIVLQGTDYRLPQQHATLALLTVHVTAEFSHFIFRHPEDNSLWWCDAIANRELQPVSFGSVVGVSSVTALGNTLVVLSSDRMFFFLWKDGSYTLLGSRIPHVPLIWDLFGWQDNVNGGSTNMDIGTSSGKFYLSNRNYAEEAEKGIVFFTEEDKNKINAEMMGRLNERMENYRKGNYFIHPFFVRYSIDTVFGEQLFSPPVLMLPNSGYIPLTSVECGQLPLDSKYFYKFTSSFFVGALKYTIPSFKELKKQLESWKDIILGINVYVSSPIARYAQDGSFGEMYSQNYINQHPTLSVLNAGFGYMNSGKEYLTAYADLRINPPSSISDKDFYDKLTSSSSFYRIASVKLESLQDEASLDIKPGTLASLETQTALPTESLNEHDEIIPRYAFVYNQRLNLANIKRKIASFPAESLFTRAVAKDSGSSVCYDFYVLCKEGGYKQMVRCPGVTASAPDDTMLYLYYPNPNAYRMIIVRTTIATGVVRYGDITLHQHPLLNGAYYFDAFNSPQVNQEEAPLELKEQPYISMPNRVYTSDIGNPFYFPLEGINTVGVGEILGLSTVTTALSQGQYGQFPLMVFCTDGNYAMEVNSEGFFSGISPMRRDVCINPASITQVDGAIVFVSTRGVMSVDGAEINCLSEPLNGVPDSLHVANKQDVNLPSSLFATCMVAYDYGGKRIMFLSEDGDAWVFSLEDATWSTADFGKVTAVLNVYPYTFMQFGQQGVIRQLDEGYSFRQGDLHAGVLVTRPLKLDSLQMKKLHQISLEGCFSHPQCMTVYASNDMRQWINLGESSSRRVLVPGSSFKYIRVAIETSLSENENLSGLRIEYRLSPGRRFH